MYISVYVCTYVYMCVFVGVMYVCMYVYMCRMCACVCMLYVFMCIGMYLCFFNSFVNVILVYDNDISF